jgi:ribosomal protein S26
MSEEKDSTRTVKSDEEILADLNRFGEKITNPEAKKKFKALPNEDKLKAVKSAEEFQTQAQMYGAYVIHELYKLTCEAAESVETHDLIESVKKSLDSILPYDKSGYMLGQFPDMEERPIFQLLLVNKTYEFSAFAPTKYVGTIYNSAAFMLDCARHYHIVMIQSNKELFDKMRKIRPDVDFKLVWCDDKNKTLYFDPKLEKRIGISCIWIDKENKPV